MFVSSNAQRRSLLIVDHKYKRQQPTEEQKHTLAVFCTWFVSFKQDKWRTNYVFWSHSFTNVCLIKDINQDYLSLQSRNTAETKMFQGYGCN